jgi:hypothetical protein
MLSSWIGGIHPSIGHPFLLPARQKQQQRKYHVMVFDARKQPSIVFEISTKCWGFQTAL